mmetsp:Transcript_9705/g.19099  ORF Transcript_9705/g.19099 Transcript_9705/m.19099 type:complete len:104 (-) Transcript_9705:1292-1603(-)
MATPSPPTPTRAGTRYRGKEAKEKEEREEEPTLGRTDDLLAWLSGVRGTVPKRLAKAKKKLSTNVALKHHHPIMAPPLAQRRSHILQLLMAVPFLACSRGRRC